MINNQVLGKWWHTTRFTLQPFYPHYYPTIFVDLNLVDLNFLSSRFPMRKQITIAPFTAPSMRIVILQGLTYIYIYIIYTYIYIYIYISHHRTKKGNNSSPTPTDTILSDVKQIPVLQDIRNPGVKMDLTNKMVMKHQEQEFN